MAQQGVEIKYGSIGMQAVGREVMSLIGALKQLLGVSSKAEKELKKTAEAAEQMGDSTKKAGEDSEDGAKKVTKLQSGLGKLLASMKRIAFYRAIRSAIRSITQGFREGIQHVYQYSAALGSLDAARAKATMDEFATSAMYVKNSLGAALMPILQSLVPIVNAVADAFVWAANAVNQLWSALQGKSVFTRAKRQAVEFADALGGAAGHAKELKKQIFGFDELNIFNSPSGGGGGGASGMDYSNMFEEAELEGIFKKIRDAFERNLGADFWARFKVNIKDIAFNWSNLNPEQVAEKFLTGFFALMGAVAGFAFGGVPGAIVGSLLGVGLGVFFSTATFNGDGKVSDSEFKQAIRDVAATLTGAIVGWVIGGPKGAILGMEIAAGLTALITSFSPKAGAQMDAAFLMAGLAGVVAAMIKGVGALQVASTGAAVKGIPMIAVALVTLNIMSLLYSAGFKDNKQRIGTAIAEAINVIAAGAIIGAMLGGPGGALIGIAIGVGLNLIINSIDWSGFKAESERAIEAANASLSDANAEAYLRFGTPAGTAPRDNSAVNRARGKAEGGFVPAGTYFYAGESGPELVGQVGGRTNVTNQDQFTAGMEDIMDNTNTVILQAAQALIQAIQSKDMNPVVQISDRAIVNAYDRGKTLAGGSLVV